MENSPKAPSLYLKRSDYMSVGAGEQASRRREAIEWSKKRKGKGGDRRLSPQAILGNRWQQTKRVRERVWGRVKKIIFGFEISEALRRAWLQIRPFLLFLVCVGKWLILNFLSGFFFFFSFPHLRERRWCLQGLSTITSNSARTMTALFNTKRAAQRWK